MDQYVMNIESIVAGPNVLADRLSEIDKIPDETVYNILKTAYPIFFSNAINYPILKKFRQSSKFITILSQVIREVDLSLEQRIYCNSMLYKEISETDNMYMQKLYYILGESANQNMTKKIIDSGVNKTLAIYLAIVRKSSFDTKTNISRLNFSILCGSSKELTTQVITNIYCAIFNTIEEIKDLFFLIIRDTFISTSQDDWITEDAIQISKNMNWAIISILDSLKSADLEKILVQYANISLLDELTEEDVRFSFNKDIDFTKFQNIKFIMDKMKSNGIELL